MKRAFVPIIVGLLTCGIAVAVTRLLRPEPSRNLSGKPTPDSTAGLGTATYKGISFVYDRSLASDVQTKTLPARTEGKPEDISPEHPVFTLLGYPLVNQFAAATIEVFPISKYRELVGAAGKEFAKNIVYPRETWDWTIDFDEEIRRLHALFAERPTQPADFRSVIAKARRSDNRAMPFPPGADGTMVFISHLKYLSFNKGRGVLFLTQCDTETRPITNEGLEYMFQGLTDDGQYYLLAHFPVTAPFLPLDSDPEVIAWSEKNYLLPKKSAEYQRFLRPTLEKLEALPSGQFRPELNLVEHLIESIRIDTKQLHQQ